jgi:hypothetical protein
LRIANLRFDEWFLPFGERYAHPYALEPSVANGDDAGSSPHDRGRSSPGAPEPRVVLDPEDERALASAVRAVLDDALEAVPALWRDDEGVIGGTDMADMTPPALHEAPAPVGLAYLACMVVAAWKVCSPLRAVLPPACPAEDAATVVFLRRAVADRQASGGEFAAAELLDRYGYRPDVLVGDGWTPRRDGATPSTWAAWYRAHDPAHPTHPLCTGPEWRQPPPTAAERAFEAEIDAEIADDDAEAVMIVEATPLDPTRVYVFRADIPILGDPIAWEEWADDGDPDELRPLAAATASNVAAAADRLDDMYERGWSGVSVTPWACTVERSCTPPDLLVELAETALQLPDVYLVDVDPDEPDEADDPEEYDLCVVDGRLRAVGWEDEGGEGDEQL